MIRRYLDEEQIQFATSQGRVLFTHNVRDFAQLSREYWRAGRHHAGLILGPQMPFKDLLRLVLRFLSRATELLDDRTEWLTGSRG